MRAKRSEKQVAVQKEKLFPEEEKQLIAKQLKIPQPQKRRSSSLPQIFYKTVEAMRPPANEARQRVTTQAALMKMRKEKLTRTRIEKIEPKATVEL